MLYVRSLHSLVPDPLAFESVILKSMACKCYDSMFDVSTHIDFKYDNMRESFKKLIWVEFLVQPADTVPNYNIYMFIFAYTCTYWWIHAGFPGRAVSTRWVVDFFWKISWYTFIPSPDTNDNLFHRPRMKVANPQCMPQCPKTSRRLKKDSYEIRLMDKILHHLGWLKPYK